jgi:hypothetical protein
MSPSYCQYWCAGHAAKQTTLLSARDYPSIVLSLDQNKKIESVWPDAIKTLLIKLS